MQAHELKPFRDALTGTFEAFNARPPSDTAIEVWFRSLREFPLHAVVDSLDVWVRRQTRAPAVAQVVDACYERAIKAREEEAERWKAEEDAAPAVMAATPAGRRALRLIRDGLSAHRSREPMAWAHRAIERYLARDTGLSHQAFVCATEALQMSREDVDGLKRVRDSGRAA